MTDKRVIIAGAGPVGTICALALARQDVPVTLLEAAAGPTVDQRAASIHPPSLEMLEALEVHEVFSEGLKSTSVSHWDRVTGALVAEFDSDVLRHDTRHPYVIQFEHYKIVHTLMRHLARRPEVEIRLSTRLVDLTVGADHVEAVVDGPDGPASLRGAYLIGADGGRSVVRKAIGLDFAGFTFPERFIKVITPYDFSSHRPEFNIRNFFSHPDDYCALFKVHGERPPGLWRIVFSSRPDESDDEAVALDNIQARLHRFFPDDGPIEIEHLNLYPVHQRVAARFRKGRVLLAGDAAHVVNPHGGMGMNGGIHDVINLADKIGRIWRGEADDSALDLYDRQRRYASTEFMQAQSIRNKQLLDEADPAARQRNLDELRRTAEDPVLAHQFLLRTSMIDSVRRAAAVR
jgi:3-(3-hydroxy-phenyl)propionate hydroxylase